ncbi:MAG: sodium-translocating pyrophosphatase [Negativicutes bacterium]|nr:sodium-translocating pyrophosphatase [Negativicutes bacterium]
MDLLYVAPVTGLAALLFAGYLMASVLRQSQGTPKMRELSEAIFEGAMAYLNRQYKTLIPFTIVIFAILFYVDGYKLAVSFLVGAICSALAGYAGMTATTKANARTTEAARDSLNKALNVSFKAGSVMGMSVAGLSLLGVSTLYILFQDPVVINSFAFGASAIAFFARVGGGIFTKAADVGADLVGKVEAGIPEDDPRNPAVIADNVGDNVGDTAGMGADLFESYAATAIAAMLIGNSLFGINGVLFPLLIGAAGIAASIVSTFFVRTTDDGDPQKALNMGLWGTNLITGILAYLLASALFGYKGFGIFISIVAGLAVNIMIGMITEYYTSHAKMPTRDIADASQTGPATNIITGIATGLKSTALPTLVFVLATWVAYTMAGTYGIAMAAMGMLCTAAMVVAVDSFGPVADNAGGIAEMAELGPEIRKKTDKLDAVGNTTAAIAKGFAIGSAALTALALFAAFAEEITKNPSLKALLVDGELVVNLTEPNVIIGVFLGAAVPFLVCGITMEAVGKAAFQMIEEVRRQFREIPGIMEGTGRPDYASCVDISTKAAIKEMLIPGICAVVSPIIVGFALGAKALAGFLAGITAAGVLLAIFMANSGGAWDNAKKYIETGKLGGKGTEAHAAAVIGDTVGDPFKDTSGPAMNPLIKVAGTISLLIAPMLFY